MKTLIIILILLFPILLFGQTDYFAYQNSQKQAIYFDDFYNNTNKWYDGIDFSKGEMKNGYFYWTSTNEYGKSAHQFFTIDQSRDFEIETYIKLETGETNYPYGIHWGKSSGVLKFYSFHITSTGYFQITKYADDKYQNYVDWTQSAFIKSDGFNKLTIRKVNNLVYFFINESFVYSIYFEAFFGDWLSISTPKLTTIKIDYFKISYLKEKERNTPPEISIIEPEVSRGFKVVETKTVRIYGKATDSDGIYEVKVNGMDANLQSGGYFSINLPLAIGENNISVKATDIKMQASVQNFTIKRENSAIDFGKNTTNEKRVALVFGNSNYKGAAALGNNPINDANDISTTLRALGFSVILKTDADLTTMNNAIREFGRQNRDADVALFYFAGHGMQVERINYLLPVEVNIRDKQDIGFECVSVETIQKIMETSNANRLNLIILDACRNNPFRSWTRGGNDGLADMTPPSGTLIAFATSPGSTAANGNKRNGLYTGELIKQLTKPQRIEDVFINTRNEVERLSGGTQSPWELARLRGVFYLKK